jgi:PA14 domain/Cellulase (glycosyl hydrolase family 5)
MRILELHTIALTFGLFIAACNSVTQPAQEPVDQQPAEPKLEASANTNPGLLAEYFDNINFTGTRVARLEPNVNFNWFATAPVGTGLGVDTFSARFTGEILAPSTGTYTFYATADDGVRLSVGTKLVLNDFSDHAARTSGGTQNLIAGQRLPIKLEYYDNAWDASVKLEWSGPNVPRTVIPKTQLFAPAVTQPPVVGPVILGTKGVNIGTNLMWSSFNSNDWSKPDKAARMKALGIEFVRLPIDPIFFMGADGSFGTRSAELSTAINNLNTAGLKVIVDLHSFSKFPGTTRDFTQSIVCGGQELVKFEKFLTGIAAFLDKKDKSKVVLELLNEPYDPGKANNPCGTTVNWPVTLERLRKAARAGSSNLTLVLSGEEWGGIYALGPLPKITDPNIIYSVHYYGPLEFSHQGATWMAEYFAALENVPYPITKRTLASIWPKIEANIAGNPDITDKPKARADARGTLECYYGMAGSGCTAYGSRAINDAFSQVVTQAARLGVPASRILLGEFGVQGKWTDPWRAAPFNVFNAAQLTDRATWIKEVRTVAQGKGFATAMWMFNDTGGWTAFNNGSAPPSLEPSIVDALGLNSP